MKFPVIKEMAALFGLKKSVSICGEKKKRRGISLAEMLLALAIVGILAAILMPVLKSSQPDKMEMLHKKASYIVEHVVADIAFDEDLYPPTTTKTGLGSIGAVKVDGVTYAGEEKFCELFASRVNKMPGSVTNCAAGKKTFTSVEGIDWYLPVANFDGSKPYEEIKFDVNGSKAPNCTYDENTCPEPDTFVYYIKPTGKLYTNSPTGSSATYCINVMQTGPGALQIKPKYGGSWTALAGTSCGKAPGEYIVKASPAAGYEATPWTERNITITNEDLDLNVEFRLIPEVEKRQIVITKVRNYGFLGGLFSADKISDGHVYLGGNEITFNNGEKGCFGALDIFKISPGCKIYTTTVEVEAGQYALYATANEKSSVEKVNPPVIDVTSTDGTGEVSFIWSYYDDEKYDVTAPMTGDHYCFNSAEGGSNNSTVSGTMVGQSPGTNFSLRINAAGGCSWRWELPEEVTMGTMDAQEVSGTIRDKDVVVPIRMIKPAGAVDDHPITHKVIVNQICPDGSSMCAAVTGAGEYPENSGSVNVTVTPYEGMTADWTSMNVNVGTEDIVLTVTMTQNTYCINTVFSGSGSVQPSATYCGLAPGSYTITAVPATGWEVTTPGWTEATASPKTYTKQIEITNSSVNQTVTFEKEEDYKYCANLTVECRGVSSQRCGTFKINGTGITTSLLEQSGNLATFCGLSNGNYTITVEPDEGFGVAQSAIPVAIENANYEGSIIIKPENEVSIVDISSQPTSDLLTVTFRTSSPNTSPLDVKLRSALSYKYTSSGLTNEDSISLDTSALLKSSSSDKIWEYSPGLRYTGSFGGYTGGHIEILSCEPEEDETYYYNCSGKYEVPASGKVYTLKFGNAGLLQNNSYRWWQEHCEVYNQVDGKSLGKCGDDITLPSGNYTYYLRLKGVNWHDLNTSSSTLLFYLNGVYHSSVPSGCSDFSSGCTALYLIPKDMDTGPFLTPDGVYTISIGN